MKAVTVGVTGSCRAGPYKHMPVYGIKVYEARPRKKDGVFTWKLEKVVETRSGHGISKKFTQLAVKYALEHGLLYIKGLTENSTLGINPLELLARSQDSDSKPK